MLFQVENWTPESASPPPVEEPGFLLTEEEFEVFERDYQSMACRPLETSRVRQARRYALERLLARRLACAELS